jgi:putative transposase
MRKSGRPHGLGNGVNSVRENQAWPRRAPLFLGVLTSSARRRCGPCLSRELEFNESVDSEYLMEHHGCSRWRAYRLVQKQRSTRYYRSVKDRRKELQARMREIARTRARYGYLRIHVLLGHDDWQPGRHQMYRLYGEEQVHLRSILPKWRKMLVNRQLRIKPARPNKVWALELVAYQLVDGTACRALTIFDLFSREALAIEVGKRLGAEHVVGKLKRLTVSRQASDTFSAKAEPSSRSDCATYGPITIRSGSTSARWASPPTAVSWRPTIDRCATSA